MSCGVYVPPPPPEGRGIGFHQTGHAVKKRGRGDTVHEEEEAPGGLAGESGGVTHGAFLGRSWSRSSGCLLGGNPKSSRVLEP